MCSLCGLGDDSGHAGRAQQRKFRMNNPFRDEAGSDVVGLSYPEKSHCQARERRKCYRCVRASISSSLVLLGMCQCSPRDASYMKNHHQD